MKIRFLAIIILWLSVSILHSQENDAVYDKAYRLYNEKKYDEAMPIFQSILDGNPNHVRAQALLGVCWMGKEDFVRAMESLQKALAIDSKMPLANYALAVCYARLPNPDLDNAQKFLELAKSYGYHVPPGFEQYLERLKAQKGVKTPQK